jgi:5-methylcytosine-specific restriction endonuclease McrA
VKGEPRFYNKKAWQRLRAAKLAANPLCEYHPAGIAAAVEVDHRIPISKGGDPWAWDNLASTCHACHSHKTRVVDVLGGEHTPAPVKGVNAATGLPLDPGHWWRRNG